MAFLRFTRDKRGYEHFSLVEATTNRRGKSRSRLLYWYRTPPNVRVGREPFDEAVRRALEAQNPNVQFDWRKIVETPIPSAETERWRERRRAEKAEKAARRTGTAVTDQSEDVDETSMAAPDVEAEEQADVETETAARPDAIEDDGAEPIAEASGETDRAAHAVAGNAAPAGRRRRRRRGRRGRPAPSSSAAPASGESFTPREVEVAPSHVEVAAPASEPEGD
jgi:hypothetical protein